jgi:hypothetical protein
LRRFCRNETATTLHVEAILHGRKRRIPYSESALPDAIVRTRRASGRDRHGLPINDVKPLQRGDDVARASTTQ